MPWSRFGEGGPAIIPPGGGNRATVPARRNGQSLDRPPTSRLAARYSKLIDRRFCILFVRETPIIQMALFVRAYAFKGAVEVGKA